VKQLLLDAFQLFFRMIPHPTKPRLIVFGNPDRKSPVLVTVNSSLTVRRLSKVLKKESCYLLVAPAGGINVWCGSVAGQFTIESIISIIKTSRIEQLVDHRRFILPQLCAPSITSKTLNARAGWCAQFGPIRAEDIPEYLRNGRKLTNEMTDIRYSAKDRIEMATAMSGSIIIRYSVFPLLVFGLWGVSRFAACVFLTSAGLHLFNERLPGSSNTGKSLLLTTLGIPALLAFSLPTDLSATWQLGSVLAIVLLSTILVASAYSGYTPFKQCGYSKKFYGYEPLKIEIVTEDCTGCTLCDWVCPVDCFESVQLTTSRRVFVMANPANCVECAACLVQCPTGAVINAYDSLEEPARLRCA
jgi:NAD-dependent dihydropyrimidine dehydrogenase PreA subunit